MPFYYTFSWGLVNHKVAKQSLKQCNVLVLVHVYVYGLTQIQAENAKQGSTVYDVSTGAKVDSTVISNQRVYQLVNVVDLS